MGRAETFESWPSEKGVNSKWKTKKKTCRWLIRSRLSHGLPAVLETLEHDSDLKALWSQSIYRYVLLCIVDNAGRHHIEFGREGLINDWSFFSYLDLEKI